MRSVIKTTIIAAIGAALISTSPVLAASKGKRADDGGSQWQIQAEYAKDAPAHNGNNY